MPLIAAPAPAVPDSIAAAPGWCRRLWLWLGTEGYTPEAARAVALHALRWGTVHCCDSIDPEDLDAAEALVPYSDAWASPCWGRVRYAATEAR